MVADGFEVNLFAADPLLAKPIQMNFDAAGPALGRVAARSIRRSSRAQKANDKIIVLEDTDGDGKADKTTVFADGLLIPTGVEPGDGGVYVANSTELLHLDATPTATARPTSAQRAALRLRHRGHAPHHPHVPLGPGRPALLQPVDLHPQPHRDAARRAAAERRRHLAVPTRRRCELDVFARGLGQHLGPRTSTAGASRSSPTAPAARASTTSSPARVLRHGRRGATRILHGLNPGSPKYCGLGDRQRPAPARRLAGQPHHQRLPRPPRLPVRARRTTAAGYASPRAGRR